jgi:DNA/RNA endonuclease YhcR with UshA esterase domain
MPSSRIVVTLLVLVSASACKPASSGISPARALPAGSTVTVEGFVTVAPGTFSSVTGDQSFAIQDELAGIPVRLAEALPLTIGQRVRVTGTVQRRFKELELAAAGAGVVTLEGLKTIAPLEVATGAVNEAVVGRLLRVHGTVSKPVQDDAAYGQKVFLDDGSGEAQVFVHLSAGRPLIATSALSVGQVISVVGLGAQYETSFEVAPRRAEDLIR